MGQNKSDFIYLVSTCKPREIKYPPLSLKLDAIFDSAVIVVAKTVERSEVDEKCLIKSLLEIGQKDATFAYALSIVYFNCESVRRFLKEECKDSLRDVYLENLKYLLYNMFFGGI